MDWEQAIAQAKYDVAPVKGIADMLNKRIAALEAENERLKPYEAAITFIERNWAEVSFRGVEAERVEGGSHSKDYWRIDTGAKYKAGEFIQYLTWERFGLMPALLAAQTEEPDPTPPPEDTE